MPFSLALQPWWAVALSAAVVALLLSMIKTCVYGAVFYGVIRLVSVRDVEPAGGSGSSGALGRSGTPGTAEVRACASS